MVCYIIISSISIQYVWLCLNLKDDIVLFDIDLDDEAASSNGKNNGNCNINDNDVVTCIQILRKRIPWLEEDVIREEINNHGAFLISDYGYKNLPSIRISAYSEDYYYNSELSSNASELNTRTSVMSYKAVAIIDKFIEIGHKKKKVALIRYIACDFGCDGFGYCGKLVYDLFKDQYQTIYTCFRTDERYVGPLEEHYSNIKESDKRTQVLKRRDIQETFFKKLGFEIETKNYFWITDPDNDPFYFKGFKTKLGTYQGDQLPYYDTDHVTIMKVQRNNLQNHKPKTQMYKSIERHGTIYLDPNTLTHIMICEGDKSPEPIQTYGKKDTDDDEDDSLNLWGFNSYFGWKPLFRKLIKEIVSEETIISAQKNVGRTIPLAAGSRSKIDQKDNAISINQKFPKLFYQDEGKQSFYCLWLSICAMVHRKSATEARKLFDLLLNTKNNGIFQHMQLSKRSIDNNLSASEYLNSNSTFEMRKVKGYQPKAKYDDVLSFILKLKKDVVCILKTRNGTETHAVGIAGTEVPKLIYDPMEKECYPLTRENLDKCCGPNCSFKTTTSMREIRLKRGRNIL